MRYVSSFFEAFPKNRRKSQKWMIWGPWCFLLRKLPFESEEARRLNEEVSCEVMARRNGPRALLLIGSEYDGFFLGLASLRFII